MKSSPIMLSSILLCSLSLLLCRPTHAFQPLSTFQASQSALHAKSPSTTMEAPAAVGPYSLPPIPENGKRLFLIRHGEVVNPGGSRKVFYGDMNVPLTLLGQQEACAAADYLRDTTTLTAVYASPLSRAYYGAQQVGARQTSSKDSLLEPIQLEGLRELKRGMWRGQTKEEIGEDLVARFDAGDATATPAGGEPLLHLRERVLDAHASILEALDVGQAAAIVSHLQVTRCIVAAALGLPLEKLTSIDIQTASITCIDYIYNVVPQQVIRFQSFKPQVGLPGSEDGAN